MFIDEMIIDSLIKSLNSIKFVNFMKMLDFKNRVIMDNTVGRRFSIDI